MNPSLTLEEIRAHQHPLLPNPSDFRVVRYEVDVDPEAGTVASLVLTLRSESGEERRLRFVQPSIPQLGPVQIPLGLFAGSVYVVETGFRGWESRARIEVGSLAEDRPTFFYAERVENADERQSAILQNHYVLAVHDVRKSAEFYVRMLGFHVVGEPDGWVFVAKDGCMIMLGECPDDMHPSELGCHNYFAYLRVSDAGLFYQELKAKGAEILSDIEDKPWAMREFSLRTLDGHRITIGQELAQ